MVRQASEHALRAYPTHVRLVSGVDSLVSFGVVSKGRLVPHVKNWDCRRNLGFELCGGIRLALHHADAPSRGRRRRRGRRPLSLLVAAMANPSTGGASALHGYARRRRCRGADRAMRTRCVTLTRAILMDRGLSCSAAHPS